MPASRLYLFDVDGTLVDCGGAGRRSMTVAFREALGIEQPFDHYDLLGRVDSAIVREVCEIRLGRRPTPAEVQRFYEVYVARLELELEPRTGYRVLPGTRETVEALAQDPGSLLGLGTGNFESGARLKLAPTGYAQHFKCGGFGQDADQRPDVLRAGVRRAEALLGHPVAPRDVWVVGDSVRDVQAAQAIGATSVAIASGWQDLATLKAADPEHLFDNMYGLLELTRQ
jgi:phosphoglycolate phosphatase-like HAD superfamily hydrolase